MLTYVKHDERWCSQVKFLSHFLFHLQDYVYIIIMNKQILFSVMTVLGSPLNLDAYLNNN